MGIRFSCHGCSKPLNIKNELAGRRGVCPECSTKFRIPLTDTEFSSPLEESSDVVAVSSASSAAARGSGPVRAGASGTGLPETRANATNARYATATSDEPTDLKSQTGPKVRPEASPPSPSGVAETGGEAELLSGDASATWYVRPPSGGQYGPATSEVLKAWIGEGRVAKTALLWRDGWPQWREAAEALAEIADSLPGSRSADSDAPFGETPGASKLTTPVAREKTSRVATDLSGDAKIGAIRQKRTSRRVSLVAVLATLVVGLIITLILVATTRG